MLFNSDADGPRKRSGIHMSKKRLRIISRRMCSVKISSKIYCTKFIQYIIYYYFVSKCCNNVYIYIENTLTKINQRREYIYDMFFFSPGFCYVILKMGENSISIVLRWIQKLNNAKSFFLLILRNNLERMCITHTICIGTQIRIQDTDRIYTFSFELRQNKVPLY